MTIFHSFIRGLHFTVPVTINEEEKINGVAQDVTERKITEEVLIEFNERYGILFKKKADLLAICMTLASELGKGTIIEIELLVA